MNYYEKNKDWYKEYYQKNKKDINDKNKQRYHKNKITLNENNKRYFRQVYYPKNANRIIMNRKYGKPLNVVCVNNDDDKFKVKFE